MNSVPSKLENNMDGLYRKNQLRSITKGRATVTNMRKSAS
jgi:hypothetical protein